MSMFYSVVFCFIVHMCLKCFYYLKCQSCFDISFISLLYVIFQALFTLQKLRKLNVNDNEIRALPANISNLVNLIELDTSKNGMYSVKIDFA